MEELEKRSLVVYLIGPEPEGLHITSNERATLIRESDLCMQVARFFSLGDTITVDEELARSMRSVRSDRGSIGIAYGTVLRVVETRAHGKQVVFEEGKA